MAKETVNGVEIYYAKTREQWRKWLEKYSRSEKEIFLVLYNKGSEVKSVGYAEAVEEALCFGWIDSLTKKRDVESRYQRFSPRKPNSNWSASNRERVERLIRQGLMTGDGQKLIDLAIQKGTFGE